MIKKAAQKRIEDIGELDERNKLDRAVEILMTKFDISEREAKARIAALSKMKSLDTEKTCEVLIRLEKIISETWFDISAPH